MRNDLTELCRQLRLAHVVEYVAQQQDECTNELTGGTAAACGMRRTTVGKAWEISAASRLSLPENL